MNNVISNNAEYGEEFLNQCTQRVMSAIMEGTIFRDLYQKEYNPEVKI